MTHFGPRLVTLADWQVTENGTNIVRVARQRQLQLQRDRVRDHLGTFSARLGSARLGWLFDYNGGGKQCVTTRVGYSTRSGNGRWLFWQLWPSNGHVPDRSNWLFRRTVALFDRANVTNCEACKMASLGLTDDFVSAVLASWC